MHDIRLDFISNIEKQALDMMTDLRKEFLHLDMSIQDIEEAYPDIGNDQNPAAARCAAIARTHLETALQYTIKALCLCGEIQ